MGRQIYFIFLVVLIGAGLVRAELGDAAPMTLTSRGGSRIKDLTMVEGARDNQLTAFGLVVGLASSGDSQINQTLQSIANALQKQGINIPPQTIRSGNVAAVMVTADISAFARSGTRIDVMVSSIGDSKSLRAVYCCRHHWWARMVWFTRLRRDRLRWAAFSGEAAVRVVQRCRRIIRR